MRTRTRPLATLAFIAVMSGACSSATPPAGASAASSASDVHAQAVQFAACMRGNGVGAFPDPDASGSFTIENIANGTSIDTNGTAFQQALAACKSLEPAGFTGAMRTPDQQAAALRFAQCIRDNGVKDFPDPALTDPLIDTDHIPSSNTSAGMTILHAAMQKCSDLAKAAGVTGPNQ